MENQFLWYLGPAGATNSVSYSALPEYRVIPAAIAGLGTSPPNYTPAGSSDSSWFEPWTFFPMVAYYDPPVAEVTPHLLPDLHPWWNSSFLGPIPLPSNPIWQPCVGLYNPLLYQDPDTGIANPPGSYEGWIDPNMIQQFQWLDGDSAISSLIPPSFRTFGPFGGPTSLGSYDAWCRGVATATTQTPNFVTLPSTFTGSPAVALRISLEGRKGAFGGTVQDTNLQSFLIVVE